MSPIIAMYFEIPGYYIWILVADAVLIAVAAIAWLKRGKP